MSNLNDIIQSDKIKIITTVGSLLNLGSHKIEHELYSKGQVEIEMSDYDNWDGGTYGYTLLCKVPVDLYAKFQNEIQQIEETIKSKAQHVFKSYDRCWINIVSITPILSDQPYGKTFFISNEELVHALNEQKSLMISVSTGGPRIEAVNSEYVTRNKVIVEALNERNIKNTIMFSDLWKWYGKWSDGSLPQYRDRRSFLAELFDPLIEAVGKVANTNVPAIFHEPTGWSRVDRSVREIRAKLTIATTEEQFQAVGLLCRETLISLAQAVFDKHKHSTLDGVAASDTDSKRMLEAFIAYELSGSSNETTRKMAKSSIDLANTLTHRRTADFRLAAFCAETTSSLVNIVSIIAGRRDPK